MKIEMGFSPIGVISTYSTTSEHSSFSFTASTLVKPHGMICFFSLPIYSNVTLSGFYDSWLFALSQRFFDFVHVLDDVFSSFLVVQVKKGVDISLEPM